MKIMRYSLSLITLAMVVTYVSAKYSSQTTLDTIDVKTKLAATTGYIPVYTTVGTKTVTSLARTPFSVNVISADLMKDQAVRSVTDAVAYTSGMVGGYRGNNSLIEISIRGIGNKSDGGTVPTYLNGSRYQTAFEIDPFFLESINVIKGPNSILYGQVNPGGVMDIITKKASGDPHHHLQFIVGNHHRYQVGLDVEENLSDTLSARLIGELEHADWNTQFVKEKGGALAPSILWKPTENTELNLYAYYAKKPKAGDRNFLPKEGTINAVNGQKLPYDIFLSDPNYHQLKSEQMQIGYNFSHTFNPTLIFRQNTSYHNGEENFKNLVYWADIGSDLVRKARRWDIKTQEISLDNQLEWKFNTANIAHTLLSGIDYKRVREDAEIYLGVAPNLDWQNSIYGVSVTEPALQSTDLKHLKQFGIYLQDQMEISNFDLMLSGRYDQAKNSTTDRLTYKTESNKEDKFTWRTGVIYNFNNGVAPYISYSTSFVPSLEKDAQGKFLKPTTATQWEMGVKYQPTQETLLTLAGFKIKQKGLANYQWQTHSYEQIGKVETKGIEVSLNQQLSDKFSVTASYAYLKKEITADTDGSTIGKTQWGVPRHQASIWAKYKLFNKLTIGAGVRYMGTTFGDNTNSFTVPAYTLYDMLVGYDFMPNLNLQLNVQNLTNKKYIASCVNNYSCFYGTERNLSATLNYYF
ncbi:TonB-dependent siderophore receptor [Pasteurella bettyae]|uniref:Putative ferrichrome-iron receptor FhuA n=1 Tax=Pasteurella bettyae CCUG 2042 TaxID=1095749 RepID=I3DJC2_9PAST|nr:TonB-dependent siderophore receptor [Pasteurella bettyae]EIJ71815.1 putative ferrichrome-iron receptor FhuA [Pasteurella bettyae CCUG 2042]